MTAVCNISKREEMRNATFNGMLLLGTVYYAIEWSFQFGFCLKLESQVQNIPSSLWISYFVDILFVLKVYFDSPSIKFDNNEWWRPKQLLSMEHLVLLPLDIVPLLYGQVLWVYGLRLVKLYRILSFVDLLRNVMGADNRWVKPTWLSSVSLINRRVVWCFTLFCIFSHWCACAIMFLTHWNCGDDLQTCTSETSMVVADQLRAASLGRQYIRLIYFGMVTLITTGFGDITPRSLIETCFGCFVCLCGMAISTFTVGSATYLFKNKNAESAQFNRTRDNAQLYMKSHHLDEKLVFKVNSFFSYVMATQFGANENEILASLPNNLRAEVEEELSEAVHISTLFGKKVKKDRRDEKDYRDNEDQSDEIQVRKLLIQVMETRMYSPFDIIVNAGSTMPEMFLVSAGKVAVLKPGSDDHKILERRGSFQQLDETNEIMEASNNLIPGDTFCELRVLLPEITEEEGSQQKLPIACHIACTYCQVMILSRENLNKVLQKVYDDEWEEERTKLLTIAYGIAKERAMSMYQLQPRRGSSVQSSRRRSSTMDNLKSFLTGVRSTKYSDLSARKIFAPQSSFTLFWNITAFVLILIQSWEIPYQVAFFTRLDIPELYFANIFDRICNGFFFVDLLLRGRYFAVLSIKNLQVITNRSPSDIWKDYRPHFFLDLASTIPVDFILHHILNMPTMAVFARFTHLLRCLRIKLYFSHVRQLASKWGWPIASSAETRLAISYLLLLAVYWSGCFWYFLGAPRGGYVGSGYMSSSFDEKIPFSDCLEMHNSFGQEKASQFTNLLNEQQHAHMPLSSIGCLNWKCIKEPLLPGVCLSLEYVYEKWESYNITVHELLNVMPDHQLQSCFYCTWMSIDGMGNDDVPYLSRSLRSIYAALLTTTTVGYGDTRPVSTTESIFAFFWVLITSLFYYGLIGAMAIALQEARKVKNDFENQSYMIQGYLMQTGTDMKTRFQIQQYRNRMWEQNHGVEENKLMEFLPMHLQTEMISQLHQAALKKNAFFKIEGMDGVKMGEDYFQAISRLLHHYDWLEGKTIARSGETSDRIFIVRTGYVEVFDPLNEGTVLNTVHQRSFGNMENNGCQLDYDLKAASYCEISILYISEYQELEQKFPEQYAKHMLWLTHLARKEKTSLKNLSENVTRLSKLKNRVSAVGNPKSTLTFSVKSKFHLESTVVLPDTLFYAVWHFVMMFVILFHLLNIPYRLAFEEIGMAFHTETLIMSVILEVVYFTDIILRYQFMAFFENGHLNQNPCAIRENYRKIHWTFSNHSDIFWLFPFPVLLAILAGAGLISHASFQHFWTWAFVPRLLGKFRIEPIYETCSQYVSIRWGASKLYYFKIFKLLSTVALTAHFVAILWYKFSETQLFCGYGPEQNSYWWIPSDIKSFVCTPEKVGFNHEQGNWLLEADLLSYNTTDGTIKIISSGMERWLMSFYWAIATLTVVCYGDITPTNMFETLIVFCVVIGGVYVMSILIGDMADIVLSPDGAKEVFETRVSSFSQLAHKTKLPDEICKEVLENYEFEYELTGGYDANKILKMLPVSLKAELIQKRLLPYIAHLEVLTLSHADHHKPGVLALIARALTTKIYLQNELICREDTVGGPLYLLKKGQAHVCIHQSHLTIAMLSNTSGAKSIMFGELAFLDQSLKRCASVVTIGYCEMLLLDPVDWARISPNASSCSKTKKFITSQQEAYRVRREAIEKNLERGFLKSNGQKLNIPLGSEGQWATQRSNLETTMGHLVIKSSTLERSQNVGLIATVRRKLSNGVGHPTKTKVFPIHEKYKKKEVFKPNKLYKMIVAKYGEQKAMPTRIKKKSTAIFDEKSYLESQNSQLSACMEDENEDEEKQHVPLFLVKKNSKERISFANMSLKQHPMLARMIARSSSAFAPTKRVVQPVPLEVSDTDSPLPKWIENNKHTLHEIRPWVNVSPLYNFAHPDAPFRNVWKCFLFCCLKWNLIMIPFRIAFENQDSLDLKWWIAVWNVVDHLVDVVFLVDIYLNACYFTFRKSSKIESSSKKIWKRYWKTRGKRDLLIAIPFDLLCSFPTWKLSTYRINKMMALAHMPCLISDFEKYIVQQLHTGRRLSAVRCYHMFYVVVSAAHWFACLYYFVGYTQSDGWITIPGMMDNQLALENNTTELSRRYIRSLYFAIGSLATVGYGDIGPTTTIEIIVVIFFILCSASIFTAMAATMEFRIDDMERHDAKYERTVAQFKGFAERRGITASLQERVLINIGLEWKDKKSSDDHESIADLPFKLQKQVLVFLNKPFIDNVPLLQNISTELANTLISSFDPQNFARGDLIIRQDTVGTDMYFIESGECRVFITKKDVDTNQEKEVFSTVLSKGKAFGEMGLLGNNNRRAANVQALTRCKLNLLTRHSFNKALEHFPVERVIIKQKWNELNRKGSI